MKTEPEVYSIDDLKRLGTGCWEGVRNYQARNYMRDDMRVGDGVLFYHSNAQPSGVVGLAEVCREAYPDHFAFDGKSKYFDPKSDPKNSRWMMVDVRFVEKFPVSLSLQALREEPRLAGMLVLQRGSRLSIQPVEQQDFERVCRLARSLKPTLP